MENDKRRNISVDIIKGLCIIGVVCIHTAPFYYINIKEFKIIGEVIRILSRVCVPLFFIIMGYYFYSKCNKKYTFKYIKKIFKVLVSWIFIYIAFDIFVIIFLNRRNIALCMSKIKEYLVDFEFKNLIYAGGIIPIHLWYLSATIISIVVLYLLIKKNLLNKAIILFGVLNLIGVIIPVIYPEQRYIVRDALFLGIFYCSVGAYIKENEDKIKGLLIKFTKKTHIIFIITFDGLSILESHIYYSISKDGGGDYFITTIPLAILIFMLCLRNDKREHKENVISKVGQNTLGIYLIHILIIKMITLIINSINMIKIEKTIIWDMVYSPFILIISYFLYDFMQLIKKRALYFINRKGMLNKKLGVS